MEQTCTDQNIRIFQTRLSELYKLDNLYCMNQMNKWTNKTSCADQTIQIVDTRLSQNFTPDYLNCRDQTILIV